MRTESELEQLAKLDREMIEHRVRTIFERRAVGEIDGISEYCAEDIVYKVQGDWTLYPFSRPIHGKPAFIQLLLAANAMYENLGSDIHEMLIDGERVALHRTSHMRNRGTGKVYAVDICDFMRFRDGLVIEFAEYPDSAKMKLVSGFD